jgi:hypothetical protein
MNVPELRAAAAIKRALPTQTDLRLTLSSPENALTVPPRSSHFVDTVNSPAPMSSLELTIVTLLP